MPNKKPFELTKLDSLIEYPFFVESGYIHQTARSIASSSRDNSLNIQIGKNTYKTEEDVTTHTFDKNYGEFKKIVLVSRNGEPILVSQMILEYENSQDFPEDTTQTKSKKVLTSLLVKDEFAEEILRRALNK